MSVKSIRPGVAVLLVSVSVFLTGCIRIVTPSTTNRGSAVPSRDDNLGLGNPSGANAQNPNNYLIYRLAYTLSYNRSLGIANWVSWHLSDAWKGTAGRSTEFRPDPLLPSDFPAIRTSDYTNSGFDRGHLCPSDDRDGSPEDNAATFYLSNIVPQAPRHNREVWKALEDYERQLLASGNEVYIIAGTYGSGGIGQKGFATSIGNGKITVPAALYKILVVLPVGSPDVSRVSVNTRVIAVWIPNTQQAADQPWRAYLTSVDEIERQTGYDFLATIPADIQRLIESRIDSEN